MAHSDVAKDLAKQAGEIIKKNFTLNCNQEWKDNNTPVTATDLAINDLVLKALKDAYPEHSVLSEEGDDFSEKSEYVWICDPVDGTHNFSHGIPTATFALALTQSGTPILSVVYDPFLDRMFTAEKGKGAFMNGKKIHVTESATLQRTVVGMGKLKEVRNLHPLLEAIKAHGGTSIVGLSIHYMSALVAAGEFSASLFGGRSVYDMTPSKLLVEEAGGKATDLFGNVPERFDRDQEGQLCSSTVLHGEIMALLNKVSPVKS
ncbi:inositol monophosphatase [Patescibacteria group bacterium]|nr:inositol monophosphatase [Patescibacteria group bacterium]